MARHLVQEHTLAVLVLTLAGGLGLVQCSGSETVENHPSDGGAGKIADGGAGSAGHSGGLGGSGTAGSQTGGATGLGGGAGAVGKGGGAGSAVGGGAGSAVGGDAGSAVGGGAGTGGDSTGAGGGGTGGDATGAGGGGTGGDSTGLGGDGTGGVDVDGGTGGSSSGLGGSDEGGLPEGGNGPVLSVSSSPIDFGLINCGGDPESHTIDISNTGSSALTVHASLTGSTFAIQSGTDLTIEAGSSNSVTVVATIPATATAGSALTDTLTLTANDANHATTHIPIAATPKGGTLVWDTGSATRADFGLAPTGALDDDITLTLRNAGNAALSVTPSAISTGPFSISPTSAQQVAAGSTLALTTHFAPVTTGTFNDSSTLAVVGTVCGTSVSSVALTGQAGTIELTGWPSSAIDFGKAFCGGAAPTSKGFTVTNSGNVATTITKVQFGKSLGYKTNIKVGDTIPAQGDLAVTIDAVPIPFPSQVPGDYSDTLTIETNKPGDTSHVIPINEEASGAILTWKTSPSFGSFGTVPVTRNSEAPFSVVNSGDQAASVTLSTQAPFSLSASSFSLEGGNAEKEVTAQFAPTQFVASNAKLDIAVADTTLCQALPASLDLAGTGQGGLSLSPGSLDFTANCGTQADAQSVTITNAGVVALNWNAKLGLGDASPFTLDATTGSLPAVQNSNTVIHVRPKATDVNPDLGADTLTIWSPDSQDTHDIQLNVTPLGDVIVLDPSPANLQVGTVPVTLTGDSRRMEFKITNNANPGSPEANISLGLDDSVHYQFDPGESSFTLAPGGGQKTVHVTFAPGTTPSDAVQRDATITISYGSDVQCATTPSNPTLTGVGTMAQVTYDPSYLNYGLVPCGGTASAKTVTMGNNGNQAYTVTSTTLSNPTYYSVSMTPSDGVVQPLGLLTLTITPNAIPSEVAIVPSTSTFSGELTITTDAVGDSPHPVVLDMGAKGLIINNELATTTWAFQQSFLNIPIRNIGNVGGNVKLENVSMPDVFSLYGGTISLNYGDGSTAKTTAIKAWFQPDGPHQTWLDTGKLVISPDTGEVFCQPLPDSWGQTILLSGTSP